MKRALLGLLALLGCESKPAPQPVEPSVMAPPATAANAPSAASKAAAGDTCMAEGAACAQAGATSAPAAAVAGGERKLGAELKLAGDPVPVAQVLSAPEPYLGKTIKCEGKVARVCQAMGCWLELQSEGSASAEGLRVPMAAHAFFVPQDAVGHVAIVEGELKRHELPKAQAEHYAGEGMKAMGPLALEATGLVLR